MLLQLQFNNISRYLEANDVIDFGYKRSREITKLFHEINYYSSNENEYINNSLT